MRDQREPTRLRPSFAETGIPETLVVGLVVPNMYGMEMLDECFQGCKVVIASLPLTDRDVA